MQTAEAEPSSTPVIPSANDSNFAGLLVSLAAPASVGSGSKPEPGWDDDALADDVASISYERALRTHARSRPAELGTQAPADSSRTGLKTPMPEVAVAPKTLKNASITIRLSEPECAQLRQRAAEAGLTISAYLRSCTLEVESLRAQVKETLAQLRSPKPGGTEREEQAREAGGLRMVLARWCRWVGQLGRKRHPEFRLNPANPFAPAR